MKSYIQSDQSRGNNSANELKVAVHDAHDAILKSLLEIILLKTSFRSSGARVRVSKRNKGTEKVNRMV